MAKQTITAFYDSREHANDAALMLRQAGILDTDIQVSPQASDSTRYNETTDVKEKGFWASLEEMFGGTEDHDTYAEGLRRGGTMVVTHVADAKVDDAVRILEQHGSVDLSERETTWRGEGWAGSSVASAPVAVAPVAALGAVKESTASPHVGGDDVVQVVEESLNVGKRAVNRGKVRLHSYVVDKAVSENVMLRDETISIDRRPVDRAVGVADLGVDAFRERTIEMDEMAEEAVVAKTARVVEEIGIRKDAADRTETITDSVRSTKVDIEDSRATAGATTGLMGNMLSRLAADLDVVGSDGTHVGVIDHVDGGMIKLKRMDPASGGTHHLIPTDWVEAVDGQVTLKIPAAEVKSRWTAA